MVNASIVGVGPLYNEVHLGGDGQLWRWTERGQETVASGGQEALDYAVEHEWPANVIELLRAKAMYSDPLGRQHRE